MKYELPKSGLLETDLGSLARDVVRRLFFDFFMFTFLSLLIKFQNQHKILLNLCYIIHQKIEKDNDKLFYS